MNNSSTTLIHEPSCSITFPFRPLHIITKGSVPFVKSAVIEERNVFIGRLLGGFESVDKQRWQVTYVKELKRVHSTIIFCAFLVLCQFGSSALQCSPRFFMNHRLERFSQRVIDFLYMSTRIKNTFTVHLDSFAVKQ